MDNQTWANYFFLYVLLFCIVLPNYAIWTNTWQTFPNIVLKDENSDIKNPAKSSIYIKNVSRRPNNGFTWRSVYTYAFIADIVKRIKVYVNNDGQFTRKTPKPQDKFLDLINFVLSTNFYNLNSYLILPINWLHWNGRANIFN